jgi:hypothetical protein
MYSLVPGVTQRSPPSVVVPSSMYGLASGVVVKPSGYAVARRVPWTALTVFEGPDASSVAIL